MRYGYARVSTAGQDYAAQVAELELAGCEKVFAEKLSGASGRKRPQLEKVMAALKPGDVLVVTRLSRLARSARDALNLLAAVKACGADFTSLREAWADTTTPAGRLALTIHSAMSEFDREQILERTAEGRAHAKARGVKLGRRPSLSREQEEFVWKSRDAVPPMSIGDLVNLLGVSRSTICRVVERGEARVGKPAPTSLGRHWPSCALLKHPGRRCTCNGDRDQIDVEDLLAEPVTP